MRMRSHGPALAALVAEGFLMRLGYGILSFTLPLYARHLGLNLAETGALIAVTGMVKVALKPAAGWLADRVGAKQGLVSALVLRSLVSLLFAFTGVPWQLYALRTVHGLSTSMRDPTVNALIAENGDEKAMGSAFAWYFTAKSLANGLGKAVAGGSKPWSALGEGEAPESTLDAGPAVAVAVGTSAWKICLPAS